jgi:hypothetical protein
MQLHFEFINQRLAPIITQLFNMHITLTEVGGNELEDNGVSYECCCEYDKKSVKELQLTEKQLIHANYHFFPDDCNTRYYLFMPNGNIRGFTEFCLEHINSGTHTSDVHFLSRYFHNDGCVFDADVLAKFKFDFELQFPN